MFWTTVFPPNLKYITNKGAVNSHALAAQLTVVDERERCEIRNLSIGETRGEWQECWLHNRSTLFASRLCESATTPWKIVLKFCWNELSLVWQMQVNHYCIIISIELILSCLQRKKWNQKINNKVNKKNISLTFGQNWAVMLMLWAKYQIITLINYKIQTTNSELCKFWWIRL